MSASRDPGPAQPSSDVEDQRFAELLKPIKHLTQNWEVKVIDFRTILCFANFLVFLRFLWQRSSQTTLKNCSKSPFLWMEDRPTSTSPRQH